ncbi:MAG: hypothetical protein JW765_01685 [Deltaproteobacteria bacterium]|nr:hypothetical protein [Candidatus Zymogenaceae bacterium]
MKGTSLRAVVAMALLAIGIYFFVIKPQETPKETPAVTETRIWPDKVDAIAKMKTTMYAIVGAEKNRKALDESYLPCAPNPPEVPDMRAVWNPNAAGGWKELDVLMPRETWFQYEVVVTGEDGFEVYARTLAEGTPLEFIIDQDMNFR